jgi:glucose-1-phosphate cytidylyltransferase
MGEVALRRSGGGSGKVGPAMKTLILAGGFGTRLAEETDRLPKPMVEIGGEPILQHIMRIYAAHGYSEFVVALGYRGRVIRDHFLDYFHSASDVSVEVATGRVEVRGGRAPDWRVDLVDTGLHTMTGGRLARARSWLGQGTFMMTYGDGVADVDVTRLVAFHRSHGKAATVTIVRPPARVGSVVLDGDAVLEFAEKSQVTEGWINGGFFVLEPAVFEYLTGDECVWERGPLEGLARDGELIAYRHGGFWQAMDTLRDKRLLEDLWDRGEAPWKVW